MRSLACLLSFLCIGLASSGCENKPKEQTFELQSVSAFSAPEQLRQWFARGQWTQCHNTEDPNVQRYPRLISETPLYGVATFLTGGNGPSYCFAIDESEGTGRGYDRLHFDLDHDGDLTNDTPLLKVEEPAKGAVLRSGSIKQQICFDCVGVPLPFGDDEVQPLELMPRLAIDDEANAYLDFAATSVRTGRIRIGGRVYEVWLGHGYRDLGWFDRPMATLHLIPNGDLDLRDEWYPERLCTMPKIHGTYYSFSTTPSGEELTVRPYIGKLGTFTVQIAGRRARFSGSLCNESVDIPVGGRPQGPVGRLSPVARCRVPVGNYCPGMDIQLDDLSISIRRIVHAEGRRMARLDGPYKCGLSVEENKTCVLDFSGKPEILFVGPEKDCRIRAGQELHVEAVLTDPTLGITFSDIQQVTTDYATARLLDDDYGLIRWALVAATVLSACLWLLWVIIRVKRQHVLILAAVTTVLTVAGAAAFCVCLGEEKEHEMAPAVTISRSNDEIVTEGRMPFG